MAAATVKRFSLKKSPVQEEADESFFQTDMKEEIAPAIGSEGLVIPAEPKQEGLIISPDLSGLSPEQAEEEKVWAAEIANVLGPEYMKDPLGNKLAADEAAKELAKPAAASAPATTESESTDQPSNEEGETLDDEAKAQAIIDKLVEQGLSQEEAEAEVQKLKDQNTIAAVYEALFVKNQQRVEQEVRDNQERRKPQSQSGGGGRAGLLTTAAAGLKKKITANRLNKLSDDLGSFDRSVKNFSRNISKANDVFKSTVGGKALLELAQKSKMDYNEFVAGVVSGKIDNSLAKIAFKEAAADKGYQDAMFDVNKSARDVRKNANGAANSLRKLANNPEVNIESGASSLQRIHNKALNLDNPLTEDPAKFKEKMDKLLENVKKMIDRLMNAVTSALKM